MTMNFRKWSAAAGLALGLFAFSSAVPAFAQPCEQRCPDLGPITCPGQSKADLEALGVIIEVETLTDGTFNIISCTPPPPLCPTWQADLDLVSFEGNGYDPSFGNFRWRNDASRPISPASAFRSNFVGAQFPATGFITFYAEAEVDGIPGVFRSVDPVLLSSTNVNSFKPFRNELFVKDANTPDVAFINDCDPNKVMVMKTLTSVLSER